MATLAFWAFVSLIFMSPVTGEEVRRRTKRLQISGPSNSKRKLASIPGSHLTSGLVNLGKQSDRSNSLNDSPGRWLSDFLLVVQTRPVSTFPSTTMTDYHRLGGFKDRHLFAYEILEARSLRSGCQWA